jgi:hypothetical protein
MANSIWFAVLSKSQGAAEADIIDAQMAEIEETLGARPARQRAVAGASTPGAAAATAAAANDAKRPKRPSPEPDRAGLSGAMTETSSPPPTFSFNFSNSVFQELQDKALGQVQPAVSAALKIVIEHHNAAGLMRSACDAT